MKNNINAGYIRISLVAFSGVALLGLVFLMGRSTTASGEAPEPRDFPRHQPVEVRENSPEDFELEVESSLPVETEAVAEVTFPVEIRNNPAELRTWVFSLSDRELATLVGTKTLDRVVVTVVSHFKRLPADPRSGDRSVQEFLKELNRRIVSVRSR